MRHFLILQHNKSTISKLTYHNFTVKMYSPFNFSLMFFISYFVLSFMLHSLLWFSLCRSLLVYTCLVNLLFVPPLCKCNVPITTYVSCLEKLNYFDNSATNGLPYLFTFWSVFSRIVPTSWTVKVRHCNKEI